MSPTHSVVFCGTPDFAVPSLQALIDDDRFAISAVITQPDRPVGRKQIITPPPVKVCAKQAGITVLQPENIKKDWHDIEERMEQPDFLVVVAYGQLLSEDILSFPVVAPVNLHASLLPLLRGASPIQHAILEGHAKTGVTVQRMVRAMDAGPILGTEEVAIDARETTVSLSQTLRTVGADLLIRTLASPLHPVPQNEEEATYCRKLTREDGIADPHTMTAEEIDRKVRALVPWPGVKMGGEKLLATSLEPQQDAYAVRCKDGTTLYVATIQSPGKKPVTGKEWAATRNNPLN